LRGNEGPATSGSIFDFGDVRRMEVRRAGERVALEPKSFDVLRHLLENRDRLVPKEELLEVVWKDTFVTPNVLTRAVAQLRKALGDDASDARYIETAARRGYRFIAPLTVADGVANPARRTDGARAALRRWPAFAAGTVLLVALSATLAWRGTHRRPGAIRGETEAPLALRRLTVESGRSFITPAMSPDGSAFAYATFQPGGAEIYLRGMAPGSREVPITADGGGNVQPAFSPDGQWLAYHSRRRGGIWVVPSTGGPPRQLASFGMEPSWAPDGRTLAFTSFDGLSSTGLLYTVRREGGAAVRLTRPGIPPGGHVAPQWSHDGRLIVFRVGRDELREIWSVEAAGGAPALVASSARPATPRFAPDDSAVYWIGEAADGNECLMRVAITGRGEPAGEMQTVLALPGYVARSFDVARDSTAVFSLTRLSTNLFALDLDAAGHAGPPRQLTFDDVVNTYPDYGPGGRVCFHQEGGGRPATAWLIDDDGANKEPLSAGLSAPVLAPQWHPDGRRVFGVVGGAPGGERFFGWVDLGTRQLTRIPASAAGVANLPRLSPDGERIAFNAIGPDGVVNVWVQRLDGTGRRQITFDRESMSYPRWSQDGRWLAVNIKRGDTAQVGVVAAEGGSVATLTSGKGLRWPYSFAPDNETIAFAAGEGVWNVFTVSRTTKEVRQLTHFDRGIARFPAWSPAGNRIVFARQEDASGLWTTRLPEAR
jgi:Tol biopolymer transport system component/DNA-binding winged helix-turn-helix (wHTH) protein